MEEFYIRFTGAPPFVTTKNEEMFHFQVRKKRPNVKKVGRMISFVKSFLSTETRYGNDQSEALILEYDCGEDALG